MAIYSVIAFVLCLLAGLCNAEMDVTTHHWTNSIFSKKNPAFWNPAVSWQRKYSLSRWVPDFASDGWHIAKWLMLAFLFFGVALPSFFSWYWNAVFCWTAFWGGFNIGYKWLFIRK